MLRTNSRGQFMSSIVDPYPAFLSFKKAYVAKQITCISGRVHSEIVVHVDNPTPDSHRITYAILSKGKPVAFAVYAPADPMPDGPCFQIGYAVEKSLRNNGLATQIISKSIDEMVNGFKPSFKKFYIEAIVGETNIASQKLAQKFICSTPNKIVDKESCEPAFQYLREVVYT